MIKHLRVLGSFILLFSIATTAHALIPNGDFEQGDLSEYFTQEDFVTVPSSPLVNNVALTADNRVAQIDTGFTNYGVTYSTLAREFGTMPGDVQDLFFDVRFLDAGEDVDPSIFNLESSPALLAFELGDIDRLSVSVETKNQVIPDFFILNSSDFFAESGTEINSLSNGFYRVKTDVSGLAGEELGVVYFDLYDGDDQRLSRVLIDNVDLTTLDKSVVPEPATMLLMSGGLLGFGYLRKKKLL